MSEVKYTSDGKKVVVIGKLNAEQTIVQEVFLKGETEIPSGKNFVVDSLHDEPVESWHDKRIRDLEASIARQEKRLENKESEVGRALRNLERAAESARLRAEYLTRFEKRAADEQLEMLEGFVSGEITHVYVPDYSSPRIVEFGGEITGDTERWQTSLQLLVLFGQSDGTLDWNINRYSDGSGSYRVVHPARSYEEALEFAQDDLDEKAAAFVAGELRWLSLSGWEKIEGIEIPADAAEKSRALDLENRAKQIAELEGKIAKLKEPQQ